MKFGVIVFPGSNCDHDCYHVIKHVLGRECRFIWHKEHSLGDVDAVVVPGGFAHGDYLRSGAIARFSPIMGAVSAFAGEGGAVIGICNGFQVLLEAGLLPGGMVRNRDLKFICRFVNVRVENTDTPFTRLMRPGQVLRIPIAHNEGNYFVDRETLAAIEEKGQVAFRYCDEEGRSTDEANPNGALGNIAGVTNERGNVLGMMPHPERCAEAVLKEEDGRLVFESIIEHLDRATARR
jgi:phosphoribosylformylglycinamidine synthase I